MTTPENIDLCSYLDEYTHVALNDTTLGKLADLLALMNNLLVFRENIVRYYL